MKKNNFFFGGGGENAQKKVKKASCMKFNNLLPRVHTKK